MLFGIAAGAVLLVLVAIVVFRSSSSTDGSARDRRPIVPAPVARAAPVADVGTEPTTEAPAKAVTVKLQSAAPPSPQNASKPAPATVTQTVTTVKRYPSFPDALSEPPAWLFEPPAPFDLREYFREPPWDQNAAPLYLDALYEFYEPLDACFPEEERKTRTAAAAKRRGSSAAILKRYHEDSKPPTEAELSDAAAQFDVGFKKLADAQRRRDCAFPVGITFFAALPHADAAKALLNATEVRFMVQFHRKQIDNCFDTMASVLRFARDMQRRGPAACQEIPSMVEARVCRAFWPNFARKLTTPQQWASVLTSFTEHQAARRDAFTESLKAEYLQLRSLLHDVETKSGVAAPDFLKEARIDAKSLGHALAQRGFLPKERKAEDLDAVLQSMSPADCQKETAVLNDVVGALLKSPQSLERRAIAREQNARLEKDTRLLKLLVPRLDRKVDDFLFHDEYLSAQVAWLLIEHWMSINKAEPSEFEMVAKAAGMVQPPLDPFSGKPLKMIKVNGRLAVYSVGPDGVDQLGQVQWIPSTVDESGDVCHFRPTRSGD